MVPITSYSEERFDGHRVFQLLPDRVIVSGKQSLGGEFEQIIMLETLQPNVNKFRARPQGFWSGIFMAIIALVLIQGVGLHFTSYWGSLVIVLGIGGLLLSLATSRKVEWVIFKSFSGADALAIAQVGKDRNNFESFVQSTLKQLQSIPEKQQHIEPRS
jgi:hypothetical protein